MPRRKLLFLSLPVVVLLALGVAWWLTRPPEPGPTYANYERIRVGMTRDEADGILGSGGVAWGWGRRDAAASYCCGDVCVTLSFDEGGTVLDKQYMETVYARPLWKPWAAPTPRVYTDRPPTFFEKVAAGDSPF